MARKIPSKGGGRQKRKKSFRPQDPCSPRITTVNPKFNAPPVNDVDCIDIPRPAGAGMMAGSGVARLAVEAGLGTPELLAVPQAAAEVAQGAQSKKERKEKRNAAAAHGGSKEDGLFPVAGGINAMLAEQHITKRSKLPSQKPGESFQAYSARLNKSLVEQLAPINKKMTGSQSRERRRNWEQVQREKRKASKVKGTKDGEAPLETIPKERPRFGEVVSRPPILSSAAMKSRAKLKVGNTAAPKGTGLPGARGASSAPASATEAEGSGFSALAATGRAPADLSEYAARVREAYSALKKRRVAAGGR